ncbi:MAG TPA: hypothetical protein PLY93_15615, partial [Turneriella sp.]|nr:hypothetical protein [Turneriella sp.]
IMLGSTDAKPAGAAATPILAAKPLSVTKPTRTTSFLVSGHEPVKNIKVAPKQTSVAEATKSESNATGGFEYEMAGSEDELDKQFEEIRP